MTTRERLLTSPEAQAAYRNFVLFNRIVDIVDMEEHHGNPDPVSTLGRVLAATMDGKAEWEAVALRHAQMAAPSIFTILGPAPQWRP
jgi:hypothetical protein